jgi:hypothetical protein
VVSETLNEGQVMAVDVDLPNGAKLSANVLYVDDNYSIANSIEATPALLWRDNELRLRLTVIRKVASKHPADNNEKTHLPAEPFRNKLASEMIDLFNGYLFHKNELGGLTTIVIRLKK